MKISLDWISDFVDIGDIPAEKLADRLTMCTAEVEDVQEIKRYVDGVLIGEVVSCTELPETRGLKLVQVQCGDRRYQTVCGAPNVRTGMKAPFAPEGTRLAGGVVISLEEIYRFRSEGVLCSPAELGMSRWHEGLLECPDHLPSGTPLSQWIPPKDVLIEIDNKSLTHRPDLWGHYGFAREIAAIFRRPLRPLPVVDLSRYDDLPAYPLTIDDLENCPCYACLELKIRAAVPSPLVIQRRLHALGQRTFNLMVDLTNYIMWELGQPTHAFDGDKVHAIRVAPLGRPGTFVTLDGQERQLLPDDLLIWNEKEPVALAGIMGGLESEVTASTTKVLLESANFKASRIRRTSVRLDLRTEAAQRFEKGQPPVNVKVGTARLLKCLEESGEPFEVTSRFTVAGDLKEHPRPLAIPWQTVDTMAGQTIPREEAVRILEDLGFVAKSEGDILQVGLPPHRSEKDLSIPADVVEEILRIYGYDRIVPRLPEGPMAALPVNESLRKEHKARKILAGAHQFIEVQNYIWMDDVWLNEIGFAPAETLTLKNPPSATCRRLRTMLMPNLLALVRPNRSHRDAFRIFEIGRVFFPDSPGGCRERTHLAGISFRQGARGDLEEHYRSIRGALEDLSAGLSEAPWRFVPGRESPLPWQVPGYWCEIRAGESTLGSVGVLDPVLARTVALEGQVVWFEIDLDAVVGPVYPAVRYKALPIYPRSWQDFSLLWDMTRGFDSLETVLDGFTHPLVSEREFLYVYKGKGLPPGQASYTFRYWLAAPDHTLSGEEIEGFRQAFLAFLQQAGISLR
ncbi:Phenylalanyl-tRNA synthetase beta chain [Thermogutta terrifontis]|uniref:Phenylalanine--tRNA ligase beta subunit n=1 Tax=Thermogutta terrifontis TaxID=1331910 RepID=A0A286RC41_9BACT|nr:phenylalanine--tRNA ligase subunit beta [Thermogutta terrifontis]ASV73529.1 Phenylalanyl-tRNA synthetase beta chain [Thermogutta terrifontis]